MGPAMALFFEVNDNTFSYLIEAIPTMETLALDRVGLLRENIDLSSRLKEYYEAVISKYGKIIGQGRIGLLELLDLQFIDVVLLAENFRQALRTAFLEFQKQNKFHVLFENRTNKYAASGIIDGADIRLTGDFGRVYADLVMAKVKEILVLQKEIAAGNESAGAGLFTALDDLLYSFIIIRYNIIKCTIDR
jgi:hypothetical protein